jgi:hypothetical protein
MFLHYCPINYIVQSGASGPQLPYIQLIFNRKVDVGEQALSLVTPTRPASVYPHSHLPNHYFAYHSAWIMTPQWPKAFRQERASPTASPSISISCPSELDSTSSSSSHHHCQLSPQFSSSHHITIPFTICHCHPLSSHHHHLFLAFSSQPFAVFPPLLTELQFKTVTSQSPHTITRCCHDSHLGSSPFGREYFSSASSLARAPEKMFVNGTASSEIGFIDSLFLARA